jgi:hypothetical protein
MKLWIVLFLAILLGGCASYSGGGLKPGEDRLENVLQVMGQPVISWQKPDGSVQLAFPRGPMGLETYMVYIEPDGRLRQIVNVLDDNNFARIKTGMTKDEVLHIIGPSYSGWTIYYKSRDELALEWRYCDSTSKTARFDALFDNSKGIVRSTIRQIEAASIGGTCGDGSCMCGH